MKQVFKFINKAGKVLPLLVLILGFTYNSNYTLSKEFDEQVRTTSFSLQDGGDQPFAVNPCNSITSLSCGVTSTATLIPNDSYWENYPWVSWSYNGSEQMWSFTAPATGNYDFYFDEGESDADFFIMSACNPNEADLIYPNYIDGYEQITLFMLASETYYILADLYSSYQTTVSIEVVCNPVEIDVDCSSQYNNPHNMNNYIGIENTTNNSGLGHVAFDVHTGSTPLTITGLEANFVFFQSNPTPPSGMTNISFLVYHDNGGLPGNYAAIVDGEIVEMIFLGLDMYGDSHYKCIIVLDEPYTFTENSTHWAEVTGPFDGWETTNHRIYGDKYAFSNSFTNPNWGNHFHSDLVYRLICDGSEPIVDPCDLPIESLQCGVESTAILVGEGGAWTYYSELYQAYNGVEKIWTFTASYTGNYTFHLSQDIPYVYFELKTSCNPHEEPYFVHFTSELGNSSLNYFLIAGQTYYLIADSDISYMGDNEFATVSVEIDCPSENIDVTCENQFVVSTTGYYAVNFEGWGGETYKLGIDVITGELPMTLDGIEVNFFIDENTDPGLMNANVWIYDNANGKPNNLFEVRTVTISNYTFLLNDEEGNDLLTYELMFDTPLLLPSNSVYWITLTSNASYWEITDIDIFGHGIALTEFSNGIDLEWEEHNDFDFVYKLICGEEVDCSGFDVQILGNTSFCEGETITLTTSSSSNANANFEWNDGSLNPSLVITEPGTYSVTVTNEFYCTASSSVIINASPLPHVGSILATPNPNGSFTFNAVGALNVTSYSWDFGDESLSTSPSPTHLFVDGTYTVTLTVTNDCGSENYTIVVTSPATSGITLAELSNFNVYPNPTQGQLTIKNEGIGEMDVITIYNGIGQVMYTGKVNDGKIHQLEVYDLSNGLYHLHIQMVDGSLIRHKFDVIH